MNPIFQLTGIVSRLKRFWRRPTARFSFVRGDYRWSALGARLLSTWLLSKGAGWSAGLWILVRVNAGRLWRFLVSRREGEPERKASSLVYRKTSGVLILGGVIISAIIVGLAPDGLLQDRLGPEQELGYIYFGPALGAALLFLGFTLTRLWWRNRIGRMASYLLLAGTVSVVAWSALRLLPSTYVLLDAFGHVDFDGGLHQRLADIQRVHLQGGLLPIGVGVLLSAGIPFTQSRGGGVPSGAAAGAWLYAGGIGWWGMHALGEEIPIIAGLGIVFFAVSVAQSLATLAYYGVQADNVVIAGVSRWASQSNFRVVNVGVLVGVYAGFLRPLIFEVLNYPILWEWLLAACIVVGFGLLTGGQINRLRHAANRDFQLEQWRTHELAVEAIPHEGMQTLVEAQRAFVEAGIKEDLVVLVIALLRDNLVPLDTIVDAVAPVVNYAEPPLPRLSLWGARRRYYESNLAVRSALLRSWTAKVRGLVPQRAGPERRSSARFPAATPPALVPPLQNSNG